MKKSQRFFIILSSIFLFFSVCFLFADLSNLITVIKSYKTHNLEQFRLFFALYLLRFLYSFFGVVFFVTLSLIFILKKSIISNFAKYTYEEYKEKKQAKKNEKQEQQSIKKQQKIEILKQQLNELERGE